MQEKFRDSGNQPKGSVWPPLTVSISIFVVRLTKTEDLQDRVTAVSSREELALPHH